MIFENAFNIGGFSVSNTSAARLANHLHTLLAKKTQIVLLFANTNFIVKCRHMRRQLAAPVLIVNDGIGLDIAAKILYGQRFLENLNGTDFVPYFFKSLDRRYRVYLLGSKAEPLSKAVKYIRDVLGQDVVGYCDGYEGMGDGVLADVNSRNIDIMLVGLGNPIQEEWIVQNRDQLKVGLLIGVGALFDFLSGEKARAPSLFRTLRLEWLYRLILEPKRLMRRYTLDILTFIVICLKCRRDTKGYIDV